MKKSKVDKKYIEIEVLSRLIAASNILYIYADRTKVVQFTIETIKSIPSILSVEFELSKTDNPNSKTAYISLQSDRNIKNPKIYKTSLNGYGVLILTISNLELFLLYKTFIDNFVNLAKLVLKKIISDRQLSEKAEKSLRDTVHLLNKSQEIANLGSYSLDITSGKWISSPIMDKIFGIDNKYKRDVSGWVQIVHPEDRVMLQDYFAINILKDHESFNKEYRIQRINDNQVSWVHGQGELEFNIDGDPIKMIGTIQDITETINTKIKVADLARLQEENINPVYRISKDGVLLYANYICRKLILKNQIKIGEKIPDKWFKTLRNVYDSGGSQEQEIEFYGKKFLAKHVPVINKGYVNTYATDITQLKITEEELHTYQEELEKQVYELQKAQFDLSKVRDQYADLFDFAPVGYIELDRKFNISEANSTICKMLEIDRLSLYRKGLYDFISQDSKDDFYLGVRQVFDSKSKKTFDTKLIKKNGSEFYASLECIPKEDSEGNIFWIKVCVIDINKRKIAEYNLEKLEKKHSGLIQSVPDILYSALPDEHGTILFISDKWKDWTGYSPEDCYKDAEVWPKSIHPEDTDKAVKTYVDAIADKKEISLEYRLVNKDNGQERWVLDHGIPIIDERGNIIRYDGSVTDITRIKKTKLLLLDKQKELSLSEKRFKDICYSMADWAWEIDKEGRYTYCSGNVMDVIGYQSDEVIGKTPFEFMVPEKAEKVGESFSDILKHKKPIIDLENWNITKDGREICLLTNGMPIFDEQGNLTGYRGVDKNITEHKKVERIILEEKAFSNSIIMSIPGLFYLFRKDDGKFIKRNDNWEISSGYSNEELDTMTALDLVADRELCAKRMQEVFDYGYSEMEGHLLTKDGKHIPYYFTGARVLINEKTYLVGVGQDISERKKMEESLINSEKNLRNTLHSMGNAIITTDIHSNITRMNPMAEKMTGWNFDEARKVPFTEVFNIIDTETGRIIELPLENVVTTGNATGIVKRSKLISRDGTKHHIVNSATPIMDDSGKVSGVVLSFSDISEQYRIQEALESRIIALTHPIENIERILFENLFDLKDIQLLQDQFAEATGVASIITNTNGFPITKPSNFCRLCNDFIRPSEIGCKNCQLSDSLLGKPNPDGPIIQPCMSGGLWDAGASIMVGGKHIATWLVGQVRNEDQSEDKVLLYADEIGVDKEAFREAFREVTIMSEEQFNKIAQVLFTLAKQLSNIAYQNVQQASFIAERNKAIEDLEKKTKELSISNNNLEQFAYAASHDLQEPLRVITSSLEIIKKNQLGKMDKKSINFFNFAVDGAVRMKQLVSSLLEVSRIRRDSVHFTTVDVNKILDKVLQELKDHNSNSKVQIMNRPLTNVWGNGPLLTTLFLNIISNGIKYQINKKPIITITCKEYSNVIEFCISDNGIGIEEKYLERIFIIFKRLQSRNEYPGTGIGLAICKNIVEVHDGKIWAESEIGKGSKFYFTLRKAIL